MSEDRTSRRPAGPAYSERLWPGPGLWAMVAGAVVALALAYGRALGPPAGWVAGLAAAAVVAGATWWATPVVSVSGDTLRAGRAHLPLEVAGRVLVLDAQQAREARGPGGDPTAFVLLAPGVGPGAVVVEILDPEDPHRTWLLASRRPGLLASAIAQARGRLAA